MLYPLILNFFTIRPENVVTDYKGIEDIVENLLNLLDRDGSYLNLELSKLLEINWGVTCFLCAPKLNDADVEQLLNVFFNYDLLLIEHQNFVVVINCFLSHSV